MEGLDLNSNSESFFQVNLEKSITSMNLFLDLSNRDGSTYFIVL